MNKALIAFAAALSLAACQQAPSDQPPLAGAKLGGPFTLTSQTGARVSDSQFAGKYRLIYFGYSFCPDICPVDLQKLMQALKLLEKDDPATAAKIQPIFITVDPARDTPQVLAQYVAAFHPRLIGLTGTEQEIAAVAKEYGVYYSKAPGGTKDGYLVDHARQTMLFGPEGQPMVLIAQEGTPREIAAELARWVK